MNESATNLNLQKMGSLMGAWTWELATNAVTWSRGLFMLLGIDPATVKDQNLYELFFTRIHPDDLQEFMKVNELVRKTGQPIGMTFRLLLPDGRVRHVVGEPDQMLDEHGNVVSLVGIIRDLSWENSQQNLLQSYKFALDQHSIVAITEKNGRITYVNDKACKISGYNREELLGKNHRVLNSQYHSEEFFRNMYKTIHAGNTWQGEIRNRRKDGSFYWVDTTIVPFKDTTGDVAEFLAIRTDITERKNSAKILHETTRRLAEAQRLSHTGSWEWEPATNKVYWSDEMYRIFNIAPADFDGSTEMSINVFHPDDRTFITEAAQRAAAEQKPQPVDARVLLPDGSVRYVHGDAEVEFNATGGILRMLGTYQDVTERVLNARALEAAVSRLAEAQRLSHIGSWEWNPNTNEVYWPEGMYKIFGKDPKEFDLTLENALNAFHPDDREKMHQIHAKAIAEKKPQLEIGRVLRPDGSVRYLNSTTEMEYDEAGNVILVKGTFQDITERRDMEIALRASRESYQRLFEQTAECLFIADQQGHFLDVNPAAVELTGYSREELLAMTVRDLFEFSGENQPRYAELRAGWSLSTERTLPKKNGERIQIEMHARMLSDGRFFASLRDLTPQRMLEQSLLQAQKLESLAVLAGGISHDFNNIISGMFGYAELAKKLSSDQRITHYLGRILEGLERSQNLTQRLTTFASGGAPRRSAGHLFPHVRDTITFVLSGSNCLAHFDIAAEIHPCEYDPVQIAQVFDNLVRNAQQAMPNGGTITVTARNETIPEGGHVVLPADDYVRVSVADAGHGIPQENLSKLFDPFFSTKPDGHGLGLASSYSIVRRHGGLIEAASTPGEGSVFHVLLPASPDAVVTGNAVAAAESPAAAGAGTILVMDDEEIVRESMSALLHSLGYIVIAVENGKDAIDFHARALVERRLPLAVILDLTIPGGMGGKEVIAEIRKTDKITPVFVSSGYSEGTVMSDPVLFGFNAALPKPVRLTELSALLNKFISAK